LAVREKKAFRTPSKKEILDDQTMQNKNRLGDALARISKAAIDFIEDQMMFVEFVQYAWRTN
jgi:hypothetical protein